MPRDSSPIRSKGLKIAVLAWDSTKQTDFTNKKFGFLNKTNICTIKEVHAYTFAHDIGEIVGEPMERLDTFVSGDTQIFGISAFASKCDPDESEASELRSSKIDALLTRLGFDPGDNDGIVVLAREGKSLTKNDITTIETTLYYMIEKVWKKA
jgi:hypothetical protein